jgi:ABC-2 type transport system ATP-binding protein
MANAPAIRIHDLYKAYNSKRGQKVALDHVSLEVPEGSFFGLLGPNGAGKSTMINILAGLVNKTSGDAEICGYDIEKQAKQARKSIGIVPQELMLDPFFPPFEALEYTAGFYGVPKGKRRTMEIITALGLSDKAHAPARSLSGGMRRRLLIAKALVHSPKVLILDEPTAGVDVELRQQLWEYVKHLNKEKGTTVLLTTHYLEEAEALCDHIAVINHGKIISNDSKVNILRSIDRKKLSVVPMQPLLHIPKGLEKFDTNITAEGNLEITYRQSTAGGMGEILNMLAKAQIEIRDLSTEEPDLEEVFRHLTKG